MKKEVYIPDPVYHRVESIWERLGFSCIEEALDYAMDAGLDHLLAGAESLKARCS